MLYRPSDGILWDTTLVRHGDWWHLFHLRRGRVLGHARSRDLLRWQERPRIDLCGPPGSWNQDGAPWTGCILDHNGRHYMLAGGPAPDGIPAYGLFVSDDLDRWQAVGQEPVLRPAPPQYRRRPSELNPMHAAWRDPCVLQDGGGTYHAFLCARGPEWGGDDTGAVVAHARSADLWTWEHLPPIARPGDRVLFAEVPDVFRIGDHWYLTFLDHGWGGARVNSDARCDLAGTFYMMSRSMDGPYEWPGEPLLIGCDDDRVGPWAGRTLAVRGERWLYHHHAGAGEPAFGMPKRIKQQPDGSLHLRYIPLTEPIEQQVDIDVAVAVERRKPHDDGQWSCSGGVLTGAAAAMGTGAVVADDVDHGHLACRLRGQGAARAGLAVRSTGEPGSGLFEHSNQGLVVWLDFEQQRLVAEQHRWVPGFGWGRFVGDQMGRFRQPRIRQQVMCRLPHGHWLTLRVVYRDRFLEVYLADRWMLTLDTAEHPQRGDVELAVERGTAGFRDLSVAALPPLDAAIVEAAPPQDHRE
jgi:hypothetical protein